MKELIKLNPKNPGNPVSARELYEWLGYDKANWKRWYTKNIAKNEFAIENQDWVELIIETSSNNGITTKEFALSIDFAKKLSMMAKTQKGEEARDYFIECEKIKTPQTTKLPTNYIESLKALVKSEEEKEKALKLVENLSGALDSHMDFISIIKVATHNNVSEKNFDWRKLKKKCEELGYAIRKIQSNRFDYQNLYHIAAFKHCYPQYDYNFKVLIPELV